jgi:hypothetical protein
MMSTNLIIEVKYRVLYASGNSEKFQKHINLFNYVVWRPLLLATKLTYGSFEEYLDIYELVKV